MGSDGGRRRAAAMPVGRSAFRADIQGLRAVAVASVVVYHLWPGAMPGGFIGVDVFFVISGFLITQQLVDESERDGRVHLAKFWSRRIRRILPAAFVVLGASLALVALAMPTYTWHDNLGDIRAAAEYVVNWALAGRAVDYLASEHAPSIVQHYWSLSVEEQFYVVWPLLVGSAVLVATRIRRAPRRAIRLVVTIVTAASFLTSIVWTHVDATTAFFATPARAWQFGAGALVALAIRSDAFRTGRWRTAVAWAGMTTIVIADFAINGNDPFPGWIAAVPTVGAVLVIAAAATSAASPTRLLAGQPVQWLGDNSYSIYLWHWPLIVAAPWVLNRSRTMPIDVGILVLTLVLAGVTKRFVEDPIRTTPWWTRRLTPAYAMAAVGIVAIAVASTTLTTHAKHEVVVAQAQARARTASLLTPHHHRSCFGAAAMLPFNHCAHAFARPPHLDVNFAAADGPSDPCLQPVTTSSYTPCVLGDTKHPHHTIVVVGNSHAWRLAPALALYGQRHHWKVIVASRVNCLGLITSPLGPDGATSSCLRWSASLQQQLLNMPHLDAVIFASYRFSNEFLAAPHPTPAQEQATQRAVLATWQRLHSHGIRLVVTGDVPGMRPNLDPQCLAQSHVRVDPCAVPRSSVVYSNPIARLAQHQPRLATFISLTRYFCDAARCHALIGGVVVYFDDHHLTTTFSRSLAPYLGPQLAQVIGR